MRAGEIDFGILEAGEGPLALCLHGFPDTAHTWRHLLPRLAEAGFHAVAPFTRGYAPTSVPADGAYQIGALVADANNLHTALGADSSAVIIGHDWGAGTAYAAASTFPELWSKLVILAVPPATAVLSLLGGYDQMKRSWYMSVCASPQGEAVVAADDFAFLERLWRDWSPGYDPTPDMQDVRASLGKAEALTAALGYYRALFAPPADDTYAAAAAGAGGLAPQPTLYLHGAQDGCMGSELAEAAEPFLTSPGSRTVIVPDAGHFLQVEQPDTVNGLIIDHLRG
ncbi:alpha/beta fold hydrolase [Pseudonocardia oroxyli]|uniref:alpha/beta fold hydrolase n=1 Tax=Pseudonocardia oroxyli TaxID=366584 RepID=UPI001C409DF9|nr:alpha/beta hydrolase [Pseudonocardia oroxyli]